MQSRQHLEIDWLDMLHWITIDFFNAAHGDAIKSIIL